MSARTTLFVLVFMLSFAACAQSALVTQAENKSGNASTAEAFIDAFYSFDNKALAATLETALESTPSIIYYQGWAKGGNYKVVYRAPCKIQDVNLLSCSITVQDDLMLALGIDFNVTDTFHISFSHGVISKIETSSNDLQVFGDAQEWVTKNLPELLNEPCRDFFNGGPTPGKCVQAMVEGFSRFATSEDFPAELVP